MGYVRNDTYVGSRIKELLLLCITLLAMKAAIVVAREAKVAVKFAISVLAGAETSAAIAFALGPFCRLSRLTNID